MKEYVLVVKCSVAVFFFTKSLTYDIQGISIDYQACVPNKYRLGISMSLGYIFRDEKKKDRETSDNKVLKCSDPRSHSSEEQPHHDFPEKGSPRV